MTPEVTRERPPTDRTPPVWAAWLCGTAAVAGVWIFVGLASVWQAEAARRTGHGLNPARAATEYRGRLAGLGVLLTAAAGGTALWLGRRHAERDRRLDRLAGHVSAGTRPVSRPSDPTAGDGPDRRINGAARHAARRLRLLREDAAAVGAERDRLVAILEGMGEGVVAVDREERVLLANRTANRMLGLGDGDARGRSVWEAVRRPGVHEAVRALLDGRERYEAELHPPRSDLTLALRGDHLPGDPSPGVVLALHDVTELRRLERLRREFVSNVSHELKTPLSAILAYAETLLDGGLEDPDHARRFVTRIGEQGDRLAKLIRDLLHLARVESGSDVFDVVRLPVAPVVDAAVEAHAAVADTRGVTLRSQAPLEPQSVAADADGLRTVLDNLLDNALAYTPAGGRVTVRWVGEPDGSNGRPAVSIAVSDTGVGIPADHLPRIFERFHRVDPARSREAGGTGLGLAIVKHLVAVFDGEVSVESEVGTGSTFTVRLPAG